MINTILPGVCCIYPSIWPQCPVLALDLGPQAKYWDLSQIPRQILQTPGNIANLFCDVPLNVLSQRNLFEMTLCLTHISFNNGYCIKTVQPDISHLILNMHVHVCEMNISNEICGHL